MYSEDNWVSLKEPEDLPGSIGDDLRFVKQRSTLWFENRNGFMLTGSKIYEDLGLDSLKNLQKHHDKVIRKKNVQENISEIVQKSMDHGSNQKSMQLQLQQEAGKIKIIQLKYELLLLIRTSFKLSFYQLYVLMCIWRLRLHFSVNSL